MIRIAYLLLPFAYISFGTIHRGQQHFLLICAFLFTVRKLKNVAIKGFFFYVTGWVFWVMISNMLEGKPNIESAEAFSNLIYFWIAAAIILAVSESTTEISKIINIVCVLAIIQAVIGIVQTLGFDSFHWFLTHWFKMQRGLADTALTGTLGNPNYLAGFIAISLPFFFRKYWIYCLPLFGIVFYMADTSTAVIAASFGAIVYYRKYWIVLPVLLASIVYVLADNSYMPVYQDVRWEWWGNITVQTLNTWQTAIFGFGPGAKWGRTCPMHNEWITMFHQFGAAGLCFALIYLFQFKIPEIGDDIEYRMIFAALITAMVNCFGNHPLHLAPSAFLILIIIGLMERSTRKYQ